MHCWEVRTSALMLGKQLRASHTTAFTHRSRRSPTRLLFSLSLSFFSFFTSPFFSSQVFESPLLSTPLSPAFWSPSELDPYNAYAFTSLYDLRNEPETSQSWFVVPFYSGCALLRSAMSPLIAVPPWDLAFFARFS